MDDYENLFLELNEEYTPKKPLTEGEKVIKNAESQFIAYSEDELERRKEIADVKARMKSLQIKLSQTKNIKNPKMVAANEKMAQRRIQLKKNIEECKLRLEDIDLETKDYYKTRK